MDGSSLTGVETTALTQGVTFLYTQAGEILRRRRDARDRGATAREQEVPEPLPASDPSSPLEMPEGVFEPMATAPATPVLALPDRVAENLLQARRAVDDYIMGAAVLDRDALDGLEAADRLRCLLEDIYGTALTFRGERRQARPAATTQVRVERAGTVLSGTVTVHGDVAGRDITKHA